MSTHSLGVYDLNHTQLLASFQWSGLSDQQMLLQKILTVPENLKWYPYKVRGVVSTPTDANKVRNVPASGNQSCSIASQDSWHVHGILC